MIRCCLHLLRHNSTFDKQISCLRTPFKISCKNCHSGFLLLPESLLFWQVLPEMCTHSPPYKSCNLRLPGRSDVYFWVIQRFLTILSFLRFILIDTSIISHHPFGYQNNTDKLQILSHCKRNLPEFGDRFCTVHIFIPGRI